MKVSVRKNSSVVIGIEYPRLMVSKDDLEDSCHCKDPLIVLFADEYQGIVISGHNSEDFRFDERNGNLDWTNSDYNFVPFVGEIVLTSDGK